MIEPKWPPNMGDATEAAFRANLEKLHQSATIVGEQLACFSDPSDNFTAGMIAILARVVLRTEKLQKQAPLTTGVSTDD